MNFLRRLMFWRRKPKYYRDVIKIPSHARYVTVIVAGNGGGGGRGDLVPIVMTDGDKSEPV